MPEPLVNDTPEPAAPNDPLGPTLILPASAGASAGASDGTSGARSSADPPSAAASAPAAAAIPGTAPAGWFGKLPMLGDFASRRLPDAFIRPWDDWLQPSLAAAKESIGERWLDLYLTFPVWRFVMPAGLVGDAGWIGVFLPSVDRVGRCFPLTICEPVSRDTLEAAGLAGIDAHLSPLADAAIDALDAGAVDFLEQRLAALAPLQAPGKRASEGRAITLESWLARKPQRYALAPPKAVATFEAVRQAIADHVLEKPEAARQESTVWPLAESIPASLSAAASRFVVTMLVGRVLWWSPASSTNAGGALRLEPYPFSDSLLGNLIGTE